MSYIHNLPEVLHPAVQQGFLEREFKEGLSSNLAYRRIADLEPFPGHIGETRTLTRHGLKPPAMEKLDPKKDSQLDSGMTPSSWPMEQYTVALEKHGDTTDLNVVTSQVAIADLFLKNAKINGIQAAQTLDRLSRDALFDAYLGGHTWLLRDDPASGPIQVNDIRGFETVYVNGKPEPVSSSHPARIRIGGQSYELIGAARHAENNSTTQASGGISGELTLRAGPHSPDKFKKGTAVVHDNAPSLIRAGNHDTTEKLSAQDTLSMRLILKAMTALKHNTGLQPPFKLFLDSESMFQLYDDPQFQSLYRGQYGSDAMQRGRIVHLLGIDFIDTTESVLQPMAKDKGAEIVVRRPILVAQGALIEADFPWKQTAYQQMNSVLHVVDGVAHITRAAINRTGDVIAQTWTWIGGFAAPSDSTANRRIIPTANDAYYKRAVIIEHAS